MNDHFIITTSKIMSDIASMGKKTIEASLKILKDLKLIESKIIEVTKWNKKPRLRGIKLTKKGKEYNSKEKDEKIEKTISNIPKKEKIESFIEEVTKRFLKNNRPICNGVSGWTNETIFVINSYNKLSIKFQL